MVSVLHIPPSLLHGTLKVAEVDELPKIVTCIPHHLMRQTLTALSEQLLPAFTGYLPQTALQGNALGLPRDTPTVIHYVFISVE